MTYKLFRVRLQLFFRKTGLLRLVEQLRFYQRSFLYWKSNNQFINENPSFTLPPPHLAFDAYNAPKWKFYKQSGEATAAFIKEVITKYCGEKPLPVVYEWGCGPARVIRHLPSLFGEGAWIFGSDYNTETIDWCKKNIAGVHFSVNDLHPPLGFAANKFDMVYCLSVFTHLSGNTGIKWVAELKRVLRPGGILLLTTLGTYSYNTELLPDEKSKYINEGIVVRDRYQEGKKMYLTIHNPEYVKKSLLLDFEILEHLPSGFPYMMQECWIARKTS